LTHTHTHRKYVILIAFSRQLWLRQHTNVLRYTLSASSVPCYFRLLCISTVCSVYRVPSVIMCSSTLILPSFCGNCSAVWDAVSLEYTCTEGSVSITCPTNNAHTCAWEIIARKCNVFYEISGEISGLKLVNLSDCKKEK